MSAEPLPPTGADARETARADSGCRCGPSSPAAEVWPVRALRATRAAVPDAVPALRQLARTWTEGSAAATDTAEDLILAVDEAVTNAVEHAYPDRAGAVHLQLTRRACGELAVTVEDDGTWRPPPTDPGFRGRGLRLIEALADHALITHTPSGTTVTMSWNARPLRPAEDSG
jgi:anti-sigma regulatory factor (Ser/Thr protein kinase)